MAVLPPDTMPGPLQLYVTPLPGVPERESEVTLQLRTPPLPAAAVADGGVTFWETTTDVLAVQPLEGFVTVRLYVPGWFTVGFAVVLPETMPGPVQL